MQKTPNQEIVGQHLASVVVSDLKRPFVPLDGAMLYTLFPDIVRTRSRVVVVNRVGSIRMRRNDRGKIVGRCVKWWDLDVMRRESLKERKSVPASALTAKARMIRALELNYVSPFGLDLPLYLDVASSRNRAYDWDTLEWDVFRGLNSEIPFRYRLTRRSKSRVTSELPFLDMADHFRSVVHDDLCMTLVRQLIAQHTREVGSMTLIPLRWVDRVEENDTIVVQTGIPSIVALPDARRVEVRVGAMQVRMSREPGRRRRRNTGMSRG